MYMYVSKHTIKNTSMDPTGSWGLDCEINLRSLCFIRLIWQDDWTLSLWHAVRGTVAFNFSPRNLTQVTSTMKPGQECMVWFCFGKENNSSRRVMLKIELELNNLNSILSRSDVTPVFPRHLRRTKYTWNVNTRVRYSRRYGNTQRVGGENRVLEVKIRVLLVGDLHVTPVARLNLLR